MSRRRLGPPLLTIGTLMLLVALTADKLGVGSSPGIGWAQAVGALAGIVIAAVGIRTIRG